MFKNGKDKCSCPHTDCVRNAKCEECHDYHKGMTYCVKEKQRMAGKDGNN